MNDLLFWEQLDSLPPDDPALGRQILAFEEARQRGKLKADRWVFAGDLIRVLPSQPEEVQLAILRILCGFRGKTTTAALVNRLRKGTLPVACAAMDSLIKTGPDFAWQLVHAFFSENQTLRSEALKRVDCPTTATLALHLLSDEPTRAKAIDKVAGMKLPVHILPSIHQFYRTKHIDAPTAKRLVSGMNPQQLVDWIKTDATASFRADLKLDKIFKGETLEDQLVTDLSGWLVDLLCDPFSNSSDAESTSTFLHDLAKWLFAAPRFEPVLLLAILDWMKRSECYPQTLLEVAIWLDLRVLKLNWVSKSEMREAFLSLCEKTSTGNQFCEETAERLLADPAWAKRKSGQLDLAALGGLLGHLSSPTKKFSDIYKESQVVAAFLESPEEAVPFLKSPITEKYATKVLQLVAKHANGKKNTQKMLAYLATRLPGNKLDFLLSLTASDAEEFAKELIRAFAYASGKDSDWKRADTLASIVSSKYDNGLNVIGFILDTDAPEKNLFCVAWFTEAVRKESGTRIIKYVESLTNAKLKRFLRLIDHASGAPYIVERKLVKLLNCHADPELALWSKTRCLATKNVAVRPKSSDVRTLTRNEVTKLRAASESSLSVIVSDFFGSICDGIIAALEIRPAPSTPNGSVVATVIASAEAMEQVDKTVLLYEDKTPRGIDEVCNLFVAHWKNNDGLPLVGHALLWRWEHHLFKIDEAINSFTNLTSLALKLKSKTLSFGLWHAAARLAAVKAARDKERFRGLVSDGLVEDCITELSRDNGQRAAELLVTLHFFLPSEVERVRSRVMELIPGLKPKVQQTLTRWISVEGVAQRSSIPRGRPIARISDKTVEEIAGCLDLKRLKQFCRSSNWKVVDKAVKQLSRIGAEGIESLADVILESPFIPRVDLVCELIPYWDSAEFSDAIDKLRAGVAELDSPYHRYITAVNLLSTERLEEDRELFEIVIESLTNSGQQNWFQPHDWGILAIAVRRFMDQLEVAMVASTSSQTRAYIKAVDFMVQGKSVGQDHIKAIKNFLAIGSERSYESRLQAANWLADENKSYGFPIVAAKLTNDPKAIRGGNIRDLQRIVRSVLAVENADLESCLLQGVAGKSDVAASQIKGLCEWIAANTKNIRTVEVAIRYCDIPESETESKVTKVARSFKWGIDQAWDLLNQKFKISKLTGEDLGYTKLHENRIYINIMPMMEGQQKGRQVVEGLILHELGHHIYHKGPKKEKVWNQAQKDGLHRMLNLVTDEHLERNMRIMNRGYDSRLKQLAAYAFHHTKKQFDVEQLLLMLNVRAFDALKGTRMKVTEDPRTVEVECGRLLITLEKLGSSFSRFFRALRMGLGNRYNDPKVEQALKLFKRNFRKSSMGELYEISKQLAEIFADDPNMRMMLLQDEMLCPSSLANAKGTGEVSDEAIQQEIHRITSREELEQARASGNKSVGGRAINVIEEIEFDRIENVVKMPFDAVAAKELSRTVARQAKLLRNFLKDLGEKYVQQRRRLNGYRLDRQAVNRLITHGDPRLMIARRREFSNDLFIGVAIDCSGSMAHRDNMELAKRFGALLCEAVRDVDGIDLKIVGFTDDTILDVGDKHRSSIYTLYAGGGNNDAAALWHIAQKALSSRRSAKLLVMISDGLPTECSVDSLRTLVRKLTLSFGMHCAQLAVEDLEEVCFPNYVLVKSGSEEGAIRKFGATIAGLIRQAVSR